ncbi:MAG: sel1 repeat family protein [Oligoflexia bacterium]|nr:sel1 repeat family protein [Oligoflexia bacterium]
MLKILSKIINIFTWMLIIISLIFSVLICRLNLTKEAIIIFIGSILISPIVETFITKRINHKLKMVLPFIWKPVCIIFVCFLTGTNFLGNFINEVISKTDDAITKERIVSTSKACDDGEMWACCGLASFKRIDYTDFLSKNCKDGKKWACNSLNSKLYGGEPSEIKKLYTKACVGGNMLACIQLAQYLDDKSINTFPAIGKKILEDACDKNISETACLDLASLESKSGDLLKAKKFYTKACNRGSYQGCVSLGHMEIKTGDLSIGKKLYFNSCNDGIPYACTSLAYVELNSGNLSKARNYFTKGCNMGANSCTFIDVLDFGYVDQSRKKDLLVADCNNGKIETCDTAASKEENAGNVMNAKKLYLKACESGRMLSCSKVGLLKSKEGNIIEAKKLYQKACEGGFKWACEELLRLARFKFEDITEGKRVCLKGCDNGSRLCCNWLVSQTKKSGNIIEAKKLLTLLCDKKDEDGYNYYCNDLADVERKEGNLTGAKKLYSKACKISNGRSSACLTLADIELTEGNSHIAKERHMASCAGGDLGSCEKFSNINSQSRKISSFEGIIKLLKYIW